MRTKHKDVLLILSISAGLIGLGLIILIACIQTTITPLGSGYEEVTRTRHNLLGEPPTHQIMLHYRRSGEKSVLVWPYLWSDIVVTNGIAIFIGMRTLSWSTLDNVWEPGPRLFAVKSPEPPVDMTSELARQWAIRYGRDVSTALRCASPHPPQLVENGISVEFASNGQNWPPTNILVSWSQFTNILADAIKTGVVHKDPSLHARYVEAMPKPQP